MAKTSITKTTRDGLPAFLIKCECSTHPAGKNAATVPDRGTPFPKANIHGVVLGAHHPARVISEGLRRRGILAAL